MLTHKTNKLFIYCGDAQDGIFKQIHCIATNAKLVDIEPFKSVAKKIDVPRLSALNQTHGVEGVQVTDTDFSFSVDGDYLITRRTNVGLGVLTADCVPVILYDEKNPAIAAIHAGWKGAIAGVALKAFEHMKSVWESDPHDMRLFIGPSAKACCYQVQEDLVKQIDPAFVDKVITHKENLLYFDTVQLIVLQMQKAGISPACINKDFNFCTICDHRFFSHRRQHALRSSTSEVRGAQAGRQITIAILR